MAMHSLPFRFDVTSHLEEMNPIIDVLTDECVGGRGCEIGIERSGWKVEGERQGLRNTGWEVRVGM